MKLYMNPLSPNVRRVRVTAAALELPLEEVRLDFTKGEHKSPEYLALNANGAVPTLVDGDFVLTESRAIMQYLASTKPASGLLPRDEKPRAETTRWQFWDASHFSPALGSFTFEKIIKAMFGMGAPDQGKIDEALTGFRRFGAVLNTRLQGKEYMVGNALTIADLTIACSLMYAKQTEAPLGEFPNLESWFSRMTAMDAWKKTSPT
ncbi:MAG TPA: glutathione S-transferase family protein [Polyangiaceae bacterium]|nr:glutathione S-transferase family protein [Polyangiaceae bacterium]